MAIQSIFLLFANMNALNAISRIHLYQFQFLLIYLHICHLSSLFCDKSGWKLTNIVSLADDAWDASLVILFFTIAFCTILLNHKISLNLLTIRLKQVKRNFSWIWNFTYSVWFMAYLSYTESQPFRDDRRMLISFLKISFQTLGSSGNVSKVIISFSLSFVPSWQKDNCDREKKIKISKTKGT